MKKLLPLILLVTYAISAIAQIQSPGLDVLGYGYNVFGEYADQKSKQRYCLFKYSNYEAVPIGSEQYSVPQFVILENISNHIVKTVEGSSVRDYAKSQAASVGLSTDAMFFAASVNTSFSTSTSGTEQHYYYTYRDANTKWRISFDERNMDQLKTILDPQFKKDLATMDPIRLFELYGTHYIASAYLGGRADYNSVSVISSQTKTNEISVAVEAKYQAISANTALSQKHSNTLAKSKTTTDLKVTGGNSEYANNINDPATYDKWAAGIKEMPVLCDFDKTSLRPIWEFCENQKRKAQLKAAFDQLCKLHPLPEKMAASMRVGNQVYFMSTLDDPNLFMDVPHFHFNAQSDNGTKMSMYRKDNHKNTYEGIDRAIKLIPFPNDPEYVYLQPQHSHKVFDIPGGSKEAGTGIILFKQQGSDNQLFKIIPVDGADNTFFIQSKISGLYITSHGNGKTLTQEAKSGKDDQKWVFTQVKGEEIAPPQGGYRFSVQNVKSNKYINFQGLGPDAKGRGAKMDLERMTHEQKYATDRYFRLKPTGTNDDYYYIQPNHKRTNVWNVTDGKTHPGNQMELWTIQNENKQQFRFVYAGEPLTYYIYSRLNGGNDLVMEADNNRIDQEGCPVQINNFNGQDNQKWRLHIYQNWVMPPAGQNFYIKCAYCNNEYWDPDGDNGDPGKGIKNWALDNGSDRIFRVMSAKDARWVVIENQKSKKFVAVPSNTAKEGTQIILYHRTNGNDQKFALEFLSPTTFSIRTKHWKALDVYGDSESGNEWKENGRKIQLKTQNYTRDKCWQLIYADGPKKGQPYHWPEKE